MSTTPCGTAFPGALCQTVDMTFTSDTEGGLGPTPTIGNPPTTPSSVVTETDSPINLADPAVTSQANFFPLGSLNPFIVFSAATEPSATAVPEPMTSPPKPPSP